MSKIKCISIDIDGTLLREGHFAPEGIDLVNIDAMKFFLSSGGKIILATGRDIFQTKSVYYFLVENGVPKDGIPFLIALNGSVILDTSKNEAVCFQKYFDENLCREILDFLKPKKHACFLISSDNFIFFKHTVFAFLMYLILFWDRFTNKSFKNLDLKKVQKIAVLLKRPIVKKLKKEVEAKFGHRSYCSSGPKFFLEVIDNRVNKFYALEEVSKFLNISTDDMAAIGNEQNDILSLESVGFGIGVDLEEKGSNLKWDRSKVKFLTTNKKGNAVEMAILELKQREFF